MMENLQNTEFQLSVFRGGELKIPEGMNYNYLKWHEWRGDTSSKIKGRAEKMVAALETTRALLINLLRIQYWPNTNKKKSIVMDIVDDTDSFFFFFFEWFTISEEWNTIA